VRWERCGATAVAATMTRTRESRANAHDLSGQIKRGGGGTKRFTSGGRGGKRGACHLIWCSAGRRGGKEHYG
jgi:hypothetical protein